MKRLVLFCFLFSAFCFSAISQEFMQNRRKAFQPTAAAFPTPDNLGEGGQTLMIWYKGSEYSTAPGYGNLPDKSGNAYHATNRTGANLPEVSSGLLVFDNDFLEIKSTTISSNNEVVAVFKLAMDHPNSGGVLGNTTGTTPLIYVSGENLILYESGNITVGSRGCFTNKCGSIDIHSASRIHYWTNSITSGSTLQFTPGYAGLCIGSWYDHSNAGKFSLAELLVFNGSNSIPARSNLHYYFKNVAGYDIP